MHYFFVPDLSAQEVLLPEEEAQHCAKVLRMRPGTAVILIDGAGTRCQAELLVVDKKQVLAGIRQRETQVGHRNYSLHMVVAPTKNIARFEWFLEKATELGVDRITPALCEHSERNRIRHDRLEKVVLAAVKQSQQAYLPQLDDLTPLSECLEPEEDSHRFIAHCAPGIKKHLWHNCPSNSRVQILIGPEGDFSTNEIETALGMGYEAVHLGQTRLRTETAALAAVHTVHLKNEVKS